MAQNFLQLNMKITNVILTGPDSTYTLMLQRLESLFHLAYVTDRSKNIGVIFDICLNLEEQMKLFYKSTHCEK